MASPTPPTNQYLRTKVLTAPPAELRLLLLNGALRYAHQGRDGLAKGDFEASYEGISRCQQCVMELLSALRPGLAPELCARLSGLYTFMFTRLMSASSERNPAIVDEVIGLLEYERETWVLAMEEMARSGAAGGTPSDDSESSSAARVSVCG